MGIIVVALNNQLCLGAIGISDASVGPFLFLVPLSQRGIQGDLKSPQ
jgi:hypothetical protein